MSSTSYTILNNKRIAIAHDYLRTFGGGERVLKELHKTFPSAPIFVASIDYQRMGSFMDNFKTANIITSWVQNIPLLRRYPLLYRPILPLVWRFFDTKKFDLVISSSGSNISKSIPISDKTKHICYCHTPPRFLYSLSTESGLEKTALSFILNIVNTYLEVFDKKSNEKVDLFIANSKNVSKRIKNIYKRGSVVINPPCPAQKKPYERGDYFLVVSRLVKYKNIDLIIKTFKNTDLNLKIVGGGKEKERLQKLAFGANNIEFVGEVNDSHLNNFYKKSKALIVATSDEDFGMTIAEAAGYGKPSIAYYSGGHKETIISGKTGIFFYDLSEAALKKALIKFSQTKFSYKYIWNYSKKFSSEVFVKNIRMYSAKILND